MSLEVFTPEMEMLPASVVSWQQSDSIMSRHLILASPVVTAVTSYTIGTSTSIKIDSEK